MVYRDRRFEYKKKYLRELSEMPDETISAKQFINARLTQLKKKLKDPTINKQEIKVIKNLIKIYELSLK